MDPSKSVGVGSQSVAGATLPAATATTNPRPSPENPQAPPVSPDIPQPGELKTRRKLAWTAVVAFLVTKFLMFLRFFFPRTLFEPSSRFRIGYPSDFGPGVDERFKQAHRIWVVRRP